MTTGQKLALLSIGLLAVGMLPLQLMSPVAPFMDILAIPAAAQRIIEFHFYMPLDNNPYGLWSDWAGMPGLEVFLATIGAGAGLHGFGAGVLAQSQSMFAIMAFTMLATWKLGKVLFNDAAGGIAALLLFWTCFIRRSQGVRGNTAVFGVAALGLAFFLENRHWLGGMLLLTSVAVYSLIGAMFCGLAVCVLVPQKWRGHACVTLALLPWFFVGWIDRIAHTPRFYPHTLAWDIAFKVDQYWLPYFLVLGVAWVVSLAWRQWPSFICAVLLLVLCTFPAFPTDNLWRDFYDPYPHAIFRQWEWSWEWARVGYWAGAHDRRWLWTADDLKTLAPLQAEIDAGRLGSRDHILHLTDSDSMWTLAPIAVYTGIDDDVVSSTFDPNNLFEQGSRLHGPPADLTRYQYIYDQRANQLRIVR